jgi:adenine/guanine/hypoxanthine permease
VYWQHTIPVTIVFLFVCLFDTAGVQMAAGSAAKLLDEEDRLPSSKAAFFSSGAATLLGSMLGTSPVIIHNETFAGIQEGGRTGLTALTVAALFLVSLPFIPLLKAIPAIATAPPLILVGAMMMTVVKFIDFEAMDQALPAFLTLTLIPMTYSIAVGMTAGLVASFFLYGCNFIKTKLWAEPPPPPPHEGMRALCCV